MITKGTKEAVWECLFKAAFTRTILKESVEFI